MTPPPPTGRFEKRTARAVPVELCRVDTSLLKVRALTENVSPLGIRVTVEREWKPGDPVLVISTEDAVWSQARVVYCKQSEKGKFSLGLKLVTRIERWARNP
jgi:hypothetical protein